jgi:putative transposase
MVNEVQPEPPATGGRALSVRRQCELLGVSRSSLGYTPTPESAEDHLIKKLLDELYMRAPYLGSRKLVKILEREHQLNVNRKRLQRLRREMGLEAIYCRPRATVANPNHKKYPYLLRKLEIDRPHQVWCADITYVPMPRGCGNAYLCAVMDWSTRVVLGWAVSNTMDASLPKEAMEKALRKAGTAPGIMNTDQGSQFTSCEWIDFVEATGARVSMDGRGRWMDNVFIERLWRSVKYENIYIKEYGTLRALEIGLAGWFEEYNAWRPHQALGDLTPLAYLELELKKQQAGTAAKNEAA